MRRAAISVTCEMLLYRDEYAEFRYPNYLDMKRGEVPTVDGPSVTYYSNLPDKFTCLFIDLYPAGSSFMQYWRQYLLTPLPTLRAEFFKTAGGFQVEVAKQGVSADVPDAVEQIQAWPKGYSISMVLARKHAEVKVKIQGFGRLTDWHGHWIEIINSIRLQPALDVFFKGPLPVLPSPPRKKRRPCKDREILDTIAHFPEKLLFLGPGILDVASQKLDYAEDVDTVELERVVRDQLRTISDDQHESFLKSLFEDYDAWHKTIDPNKAKMKAFAIVHGLLLGFSMYGIE